MTDQAKKNLLLQVKGLRIEGYANEKWIEIVHGVDMTLHRGAVIGLIGESGAGKFHHRARHDGLHPGRLPGLRRNGRVRWHETHDDAA